MRNLYGIIPVVIHEDFDAETSKQIIFNEEITQALKRFSSGIFDLDSKLFYLDINITGLGEDHDSVVYKGFGKVTITSNANGIFADILDFSINSFTQVVIYWGSGNTSVVDVFKSGE